MATEGQVAVRSGTDRDAPRSPETGLLDSVLQATGERREKSTGPLDELLAAPTREERLRVWLRHSGHAPETLTPQRLLRLLNRDVARIDAIVARQLNAILHHPRLQRLEASWRGLKYLADQVEQGANIRIRMLNVSWRTLVRDLDKSIEFDQSQLFKKVYSEEFGNPGGEPFSVLLGDYEIRRGFAPGCPIDDVDGLRSVSQVAAAAFAPFVAGVHPSMFGLNDFTELQRPMDLSAVFREPEYAKWNALRDAPDSRFVGMTLPRVLMRLPCAERETLGSGFRFEEATGGRHERYLWGNAVYAFGAVLARAFARSAWLADIRGVRRDSDEGGLVTDLPVMPFPTDNNRVATKSSTEVIITDTLEKDLSELGFIPLCHCKDTEFSAFYSNCSIQDPQVFDDESSTANAKLSAMLQYMLCVARLAHYLKVMGRDKVGSFMEPADCESYLNDWLQQYVTQDDEATQEVKAQFPLREAYAQVREQPGRPGSYGCVIHLQPHYQLDGMVSAVRLTTELAPATR